MENVVLTPHVAGYSADGVALRWRLSVETVLALARGEPPRSWVNRQMTPFGPLSPLAPIPEALDPLPGAKSSMPLG
jgi:hypothetical protein